MGVGIEIEIETLAVTAVIGLFAATVLGRSGGRFWFFDLFSHFPAQYAGALLAVATALFALGRAGWAFAAAALGLVNVAVVARQFFGPPDVPPAGDGSQSERIRFVLLNVLVRNRDHEAVLRFLKESDADVVLLQEIDSRWVAAVSELDARYPVRVKAAESTPYGIGLWSRLPARSWDVFGVAREDIPSIAATLDVSGRELVVLGSHPPPPWNGAYASIRDRQLEALGQRAAAAGRYVVLMGDLNTTPWGRAFREMMRASGLRETSRGRGFSWSWPSVFPPLAILIDHALVSEGVRVVARRTGPAVGSDHYPIVLDITLD